MEGEGTSKRMTFRTTVPVHGEGTLQGTMLLVPFFLCEADQRDTF